jgi:NADH-quinone oxidoreductase E subunit
MLTEAGIARIEELCKHYPNKKSALVPALYVAQREYGGWLPREAMVEVAEVLELPESHVFGVASFYSMFYRRPVGKTLVQVCTTSPCQLRGACETVEVFKKKLGIEVGQTTPDGEFTLQEVECLAACHEAPMAQINEDYYFQLDEAKIDEIVAALKKGEKPPYAEFEKFFGNAHPITLTDEELGINTHGISRAENIEKKEKPVEDAATAESSATTT